MMSGKSVLQYVFIIFVLVVLTATVSPGQTTAFNYQGRLTNVGLPANADYDFQFTVFDALNGGAIIAGQQQLNVAVVNGVFNVSLDFGAGAFPGANRYLEIAVRLAGGGAFTTLLPRQQILSAPYAIKSLTATTSDNSTQLGGVDSTRFVQQDAGGNVSIAGGLTVNGSLSLNTVNAASQYNLGGQRILSSPSGQNLFVGLNAGRDNSTGNLNTFVGGAAGQGNTMGIANSFFGANAGASNRTGGENQTRTARRGRTKTRQNDFLYGDYYFARRLHGFVYSGNLAVYRIRRGLAGNCDIYRRQRRNRNFYVRE